MHLIAVILSDFIPLLCIILGRMEFSVSSKPFLLHYIILLSLLMEYMVELRNIKGFSYQN